MSAEWILHWGIMSLLGTPCRYGWLHASAFLVRSGCSLAALSTSTFLQAQMACLVLWCSPRLPHSEASASQSAPE